VIDPREASLRAPRGEPSASKSPKTSRWCP